MLANAAKRKPGCPCCGCCCTVLRQVRVYDAGAGVWKCSLFSQYEISKVINSSGSLWNGDPFSLCPGDSLTVSLFPEFAFCGADPGVPFAWASLLIFCDGVLVYSDQIHTHTGSLSYTLAGGSACPCETLGYSGDCEILIDIAYVTNNFGGKEFTAGYILQQFLTTPTPGCVQGIPNLAGAPGISSIPLWETSNIFPSRITNLWRPEGLLPQGQFTYTLPFGSLGKLWTLNAPPKQGSYVHIQSRWQSKQFPPSGAVVQCVVNASLSRTWTVQNLEYFLTLLYDNPDAPCGVGSLTC